MGAFIQAAEPKQAIRYSTVQHLPIPKVEFDTLPQATTCISKPINLVVQSHPSLPSLRYSMPDLRARIIPILFRNIEPVVEPSIIAFESIIA